MDKKGFRPRKSSYCIRHGVIAAMICLAAANSYGAIIGFQPADQIAALGSQASVSVVVGDLTDTFVGEFDVLVSFDENLVSVADVTLGSSLGGLADRFDDIASPAAGVLNVASLSLVLDLTALQTGLSDITLFTITFDTLFAGVSPLNLTGNILGSNAFIGDELGQAIDVDAIGAGSIEIFAAIAVAEPPLGLLLGCGLGVLMLRRLRTALYQNSIHKRG